MGRVLLVGTKPPRRTPPPHPPPATLYKNHSPKTRHPPADQNRFPPVFGTFFVVMKFKQCIVIVSVPLDDTALNWGFRLNFDSKFVAESFFHLNQFQKKTETRQNPPKNPPKITRLPPLFKKSFPQKPATRHID